MQPLGKSPIVTLRPFTTEPGANPRLPGKYIQRIMRRHKVTISALAKRLGITQKRVRHVRANGISGLAYCLDWFEAITETGMFQKK